MLPEIVFPSHFKKIPNFRRLRKSLCQIFLSETQQYCHHLSNFVVCLFFVEVKGCVRIGEQKQLLRDAGFTELDFFGWNDCYTSLATRGGILTAVTTHHSFFLILKDAEPLKVAFFFASTKKHYWGMHPVHHKESKPKILQCSHILPCNCLFQCCTFVAKCYNHDRSGNPLSKKSFQPRFSVCLAVTWC